MVAAVGPRSHTGAHTEPRRRCTAPDQATPLKGSCLNSPILHWSFSKGEDSAHILTYDSRSGHSTAAPAWEQHVELDGFRVPFGDGSLRLMDPEHTRHQGTYSCIFSMPYNTHTERSDVVINFPTQTSYWWIVGLVVAVTVLALTAMLVYLKLRGNAAKSSSRYPEEETELNSVRGTTEETGKGVGWKYLHMWGAKVTTPVVFPPETTTDSRASPDPTTDTHT